MRLTRPIALALAVVLFAACGAERAAGPRAGAQPLRGGHLQVTSGSDAPLFIVDGTRLLPGAALRVPADSIVTVEILKAPAAVARYGSDGARGVVLITTRHAAAR
jgi:TonB-dependent SusC/RagA subfamily outer membrane receptor